jgi:hypothetical protein
MYRTSVVLFHIQYFGTADFQQMQLSKDNYSSVIPEKVRGGRMRDAGKRCNHNWHWHCTARRDVFVAC